MEERYGLIRSNTCLGDLIRHLAEVHLVLTKAIDELSEEEEEHWHGSSMDDSSEAASSHEEAVPLVGKGEQLVEGHTLLRPLLLILLARSLGRRTSIARIHCHCFSQLFSRSRAIR